MTDSMLIALAAYAVVAGLLLIVLVGWLIVRALRFGDVPETRRPLMTDEQRAKDTERIWGARRRRVGWRAMKR